MKQDITKYNPDFFPLLISSSNMLPVTHLLP